MPTKLERKRMGDQMKRDASSAPATKDAPRTSASTPATIDDLQLTAYESQARPLAEYPDLADVLPDLCVEYRAVHEQIAALEKRKKELSATISPLMEAFNANSITDGDSWTVVRSRGTNSTISKTRLVEKGVSVDIITYATVKTPYWYVQVLNPKRASAKDK